MPRLSTLIATAAIILAAITTPPAHAQFNIFGLSDSTPPPPALAKELHKPVTAKLMATLAAASRAGLAFTGKPADTDLLAIKGPRPNNGSKTGLLYIGADFCPYCAGDRWGLILTLLRFGKLDGVRYMLSSSSDVYANTPTVTFQHATYRSDTVDFQAVETADRNEHPLMVPDKLQTKIFTTFDAPPYVQYSQSIPFVYLDGKYQLNALLVAPQDLSGKDWQRIATAFADPKSALFKSVMPKVNLLTAAICHTDGGKPVDVCTAPGVKAATGVLAGLHASK